MSSLNLQCSKCDETTSLKTSQSVVTSSKAYDVNRRAVYFSLESDIGFSGIEKFSVIFELPNDT